MDISSGSAGRGLIYLVTGVDKNRAGGKTSADGGPEVRDHLPVRYEGVERLVGAVSGAPSERNGSHHASHYSSARSARGHLHPKVTLKTHPNVSATESSPQGASH